MREQTGVTDPGLPNTTQGGETYSPLTGGTEQHLAALNLIDVLKNCGYSLYQAIQFVLSFFKINI